MDCLCSEAWSSSDGQSPKTGLRESNVTHEIISSELPPCCKTAFVNTAGLLPLIPINFHSHLHGRHRISMRAYGTESEDKLSEYLSIHDA